jgi:hypothetical protein
MSMNFPTESAAIRSLRGFPLLAASVVVIILATGYALAQAPAAGTPAPAEAAPLAQVTVPPSKPINDHWTLHRLQGKIDVLVNPDGTYDFSGSFKDKKPGDDFDITWALKSSTGALYLFHYEGDAANGIEFSKTGQSAILKDDFATFAHHGWSAVYSFHLSAAGRRAHYEAMEKKREQLHKEEEAAEKAHNEAVLKQKREEELAEAKAELKWEESYESSHPGGNPSSSGGSVATDISDATNTFNSAVSSVKSTMLQLNSIF